MHHKTRQTALHLALLLLTVTTAKAQFDIEDSHTTANLRGVSNVGGGVVWASGENGTVRRSEDEGYLWQLCTIPPGAEKLDFRGIQAFDANTAIVMSSGKGDLSRLYKTTDGCQTWKLLFTNPDKEGFWDAIQFAERIRRVRVGMIGDPVDGHLQSIRLRSMAMSRWDRSERSRASRPINEDESLFAASNSSLPVERTQLSFVTGGQVAQHMLRHWRQRCYDSSYGTKLASGHGSHFRASEAERSAHGLENATSGAFSLAASIGCNFRHSW